MSTDLSIEACRDRFLAKVDVVEDGCWVWTGHISPYGYGRFRVNRERQTKLAHRISYEMHVGPVPPDLTLDHLCRNRACVNPDHLEAVSIAVNIRRGSQAQKTHCIHGHEYTPENTATHNGWRACRTCMRERARKRVRPSRAKKAPE